MVEVFVHPRVKEKRPWIRDHDVIYAWNNFMVSQNRKVPNSHQVVRIGVSKVGEIYEMIGAEKDGDILIYHAKTPPSKSVLEELGL